ncbi:MAG: hypothetical protein ACLU3I_00505 [Acutalibacteraceae bacterium]
MRPQGRTTSPATASRSSPDTTLCEYQRLRATSRTTTRRPTCTSTRVETLEQFGYHQYEISNFAKHGFVCRHNMKYWTGDEYLGFGPCAASDFAGKPLHHRADIEKYIEGVIEKGVDSVRVRDWCRMRRARGRVPDAPPADRRRHRGGRVYKLVPPAVRAAARRFSRSSRQQDLCGHVRRTLASDAEGLHAVKFHSWF